MLAGVGAMRECLFKQFAFLESVADLRSKSGRIRVFHVQYRNARSPASCHLDASAWRVMKTGTLVLSLSR